MFGLLYARQSCANQPPGSDAVVVLLALARPTTEWHHTFRVADSIHASQHRSVVVSRVWEAQDAEAQERETHPPRAKCPDMREAPVPLRYRGFLYV